MTIMQISGEVTVHVDEVDVEQEKLNQVQFNPDAAKGTYSAFAVNWPFAIDAALHREETRKMCTQLMNAGFYLHPNHWGKEHVDGSWDIVFRIEPIPAEAEDAA